MTNPMLLTSLVRTMVSLMGSPSRLLQAGTWLMEENFVSMMTSSQLLASPYWCKLLRACLLQFNPLLRRLLSIG